MLEIRIIVTPSVTTSYFITELHSTKDVCKNGVGILALCLTVWVNICVPEIIGKTTRVEGVVGVESGLAVLGAALDEGGAVFTLWVVAWFIS